MALNIRFLGAAETVTGSCYLVTAGNTQFIVDCGMFQGPGVEGRNLDEFDFDPKQVQFVLLTHTHIDHSGLIPKLVKHGFNGPIYATMHTVQLATILLLDSAKIQEANFREGIPWKHAKVVGMAYGTPDAENAISLMHSLEMTTRFQPTAEIAVTYIPAAHVLGAASIVVETEGKKIIFSGDIGRVNHELLGGFDLTYHQDADYIVMESLYGGQYHPKRQESVAELIGYINQTLDRGGSVFIPAFAVQRTQELLHDLKFAKQSGALPADIPVWLDSPMAQRVTNVYADALDHGEESMFNFPELHYIKSYGQSQRISTKSRQIILAGSGMADGGRIMEHLLRNLANLKNSVIFVGYQAEGTLGRELVTGANSLVIYDKEVKVKAEIHHLLGFSAHGDTNDYLAWINRFRSERLKKIFMVHAEHDRAQALAEILAQNGLAQTYIPKWKEEIELD